MCVCKRERGGEGRGGEEGGSVLVSANTAGANKVVTSKSNHIEALLVRFS